VTGDCTTKSPAMLHFVLSRTRGSRYYALYRKLAALSEQQSRTAAT
jgi:hypothetical protein